MKECKPCQKFASLNMPGAGSVKNGSTKESVMHKCVRKDIDALRQEFYSYTIIFADTLTKKDATL